MPGTSESLHGSAPDTHPVALLLVDVINPPDFPESDQLLRHAVPAAEKLAGLKKRARKAGVPVAYANDTFGRWRSDLTAVDERCREPSCEGAALVELLRPGKDDYFVLIKPKHSAFFSTTLDTFLWHLGTRTLVIGGFAADVCGAVHRRRRLRARPAGRGAVGRRGLERGPRPRRGPGARAAGAERGDADGEGDRLRDPSRRGRRNIGP